MCALAGVTRTLVLFNTRQIQSLRLETFRLCSIEKTYAAPRNDHRFDCKKWNKKILAHKHATRIHSHSLTHSLRSTQTHTLTAMMMARKENKKEKMRMACEEKDLKTYSPIQNVYPSRWHSVSKLMSIVLAVDVVVVLLLLDVVVATAGNAVLVCDANQLNIVDDDEDDDDDGGGEDGVDAHNDGSRLGFLRTFIRLFIFNICSLLSRISRRFAKFTVTISFESIIFNLSLWSICFGTGNLFEDFGGNFDDLSLLNTKTWRF